MPGLVPGISLRRAQCRSIGMAGTSPAMTQSRRARLTAKRENIVTDIETYDCSLRFSYVWRILAHDSEHSICGATPIANYAGNTGAAAATPTNVSRLGSTASCIACSGARARTSLRRCRSISARRSARRANACRSIFISSAEVDELNYKRRMRAFLCPLPVGERVRVRGTEFDPNSDPPSPARLARDLSPLGRG